MITKNKVSHTRNFNQISDHLKTISNKRSTNSRQESESRKPPILFATKTNTYKQTLSQVRFVRMVLVAVNLYNKIYNKPGKKIVGNQMN